MKCLIWFILLSFSVFVNWAYLVLFWLFKIVGYEFILLRRCPRRFKTMSYMNALVQMCIEQWIRTIIWSMLLRWSVFPNWTKNKRQALWMRSTFSTALKKISILFATSIWWKPPTIFTSSMNIVMKALWKKCWLKKINCLRQRRWKYFSSFWKLWKCWTNMGLFMEISVQKMWCLRTGCSNWGDLIGLSLNIKPIQKHY